MSRGSRRKWLRDRAEARSAAGLPPKRPRPKSHYTSSEIAGAFSDAAAEPKRWGDHTTTDPNWDWRKARKRKEIDSLTRIAKEHLGV